ncbi:2-oxo-4-hydroxy-4-carboxy-5-ureidoimidazoline decarboxylase [Streptomyces similanensis]|uniref:2-oxo-4-hydroxy-4-carboxy-5-ureidoimidazoline decarboxylase n=1 Tax=Streptomyces similanensis TaxID=1274988 RepID=UPI003CD0A9CC
MTWPHSSLRPSPDRPVTPRSPPVAPVDPVDPVRGPTLPAQTLEHFNTAPPDEARRTLLTCLHSTRWAHRLTAHRPYPDLPALLAAADEAAYDLSPADLAEALATEPAPALPAGIYLAASTALSAARSAYEARFGHRFVVCLDDIAPDEAVDRALAAIRSRLTNDPEEERITTADELRRLARGRLGTAVEGPGAAPPSGSAAGREQPAPARVRQQNAPARPAAAPTHPSVQV